VGHLLPPISDIYTLASRNSLRTRGCENRCTWRVRGCISQIISLQLFLRCSKCRYKVEPAGANLTFQGGNLIHNVVADIQNFHCSERIGTDAYQDKIFCLRCAGDSQLTPVWQMSCFVDDGTAEFKVLAENELFFSIIKHGSLATAHITELRQQLESSVYKIGTMKVYIGNQIRNNSADKDSFFSASDSDGDGDIKEQIAISRARRNQTTENPMLVQSIVKTDEEVKKMENKLLKLIGYIRKQNILDISVKVIPNDKNADLVVKKKIKVQKISSSWLMENVECVSSFNQKMVVEALSVDILEESAIHNMSWLLLKELEKR
jgi:hypothetical protein